MVSFVVAMNRVDIVDLVVDLDVDLVDVDLDVDPVDVDLDLDLDVDLVLLSSGCIFFCLASRPPAVFSVFGPSGRILFFLAPGCSGSIFVRLFFCGFPVMKIFDRSSSEK